MQYSAMTKKYPVAFYVLPVVILLVAGEILAWGVYTYRYRGEQDRVIRAFVGLEADYNPDMVSNYLPHPYLVYVLNPNTQYYHESFYGKAPKQFINSQGFRGKEFTKEKSKGVYRIVCIGGSTTFSYNETDETKTYPQLLEDALNTTFESPSFEVINAGTPGWTTAENLINLQFRLLELKPDMVILYEGVNDTYALRMDEEGKSDYSNFRRIVNYTAPGAMEKFLFRASRMYRLYFVTTHQVAFDINAIAAKPYPPEKKVLENLDKGTGKYFRSNMDSMVVLAQSRDITPVLMTMGHGPWHPSLMRLNGLTREVAAARGAVLVDFEVTSQPTYFVQDLIHLTRAGNTAMARILVEKFSETDLPFRKRSAS